MSVRPLRQCVLSLTLAWGCSCSNLSHSLDYHREETSQMPSDAPSSRSVTDSKPPLSAFCSKRSTFTNLYLPVALFVIKHVSIHLRQTTNTKHHLLPAPTGPGAGRSGARVQTEVNRKWLFSPAPRSWPQLPSLFFLCPFTHSAPPQRWPHFYFSTSSQPRGSARRFPPLCHVKKRRFVSVWPHRTRQSFLSGKKKKLSLPLISFRPEAFF